MKVAVLLSGGIDSTTVVAWAKALGYDILPITFDYGQKHIREVQAVRAIADHFELDRLIKFNLGHIYEGFDGCLVDPNTPMPKGMSYEQLQAAQGTAETYVPFRNGILLSIATARAYMEGFDAVAYGAHSTDARGGAYPDCTETFVNYMTSAIFTGTGKKVTLMAPFIKLTKAGVIAKGLELGAPYELTYSCYEGGDKPCGECPTCLERIEAFRINGVDDPALPKDDEEE